MENIKRIAVIGAVLEKPRQSQNAFNDTMSEFRGIIKGRMGIPFEEEDAAVIAITLLGELDEINALTGKLGNLPGVTVKAAVSGARPAAGPSGRDSGRDILKGEDCHV
jgi:putative iron-only hydrogenase system regulator